MRRFWDKVRKDADGCWRWTGAIQGAGYGNFWVDDKCRLSHRVAYDMLVGPIPEGLELDHLCRNRECVNPAHLEPVTRTENQRRGLRAMRVECVNGHPYDAANTYRRPNGTRDCRACIRERVARYKARLVEGVPA
jgi:hypothetical protein